MTVNCDMIAAMTDATTAPDPPVRDTHAARQARRVAAARRRFRLYTIELREWGFDVREPDELIPPPR